MDHAGAILLRDGCPDAGFRARPCRRRGGDDRRCRIRHRHAAVRGRAGTGALAAVAAERGHFRPRPGAGGAVRPGRDRADPAHRFLSDGRRPCSRPATGPLLDRAGAADAAERRPAAYAVWREGLRDPDVPGPVADPAHHHRRGAERTAGGGRRPGLARGAQERRRDCRTGGGGGRCCRRSTD